MTRRAAVAVDEDDLQDVAAAIRSTCGRWGGASNLLVPVRRGALELPDPWRTALEDTLLDAISPRGVADEGLTFRGTDRLVKSPGGQFLPGILVDCAHDREYWRPVDGSLPPVEDPWYVAYLGALGAWDETLNAWELQRHRLRPDLEWDDVIPYDTGEAGSPGALDLLDRVRSHSSISPAVATGVLLTPAPARGRRSFPAPSVAELERGELESNVVVVYRPGSVADLCLLWALRAAHGLPAGVPLAAPDGPEVVEALDAWATGRTSLGWGRKALTSFSVARGRLERIAEEAAGKWEVAAPETVMRFADRPGRVSSEVAVFVDGQAVVPGWSSSDRDEVARYDRPHGGSAAMVARFSLRDRRIPHTRALDGDYALDSTYRGGGFEIPAQRADRLATIRVPAGWTVLEAAAADRGLAVTPSAGGQAAAALLRQLGSLEALTPLASFDAIGLLHRLGERGGMSWFRDRVRSLGRSVAGQEPAAALERVEAQLSALTLGPDRDHQQDMTFSAMVQRFGSKPSAEAWVGWAEQGGLVVRGAQVVCGRCDARDWRAMGELSPPMTCRGCGTSMLRPYGADALTFRYRATETALRVVEHDALVHLLAMRYLCELFRSGFDRPSEVYGAFPGVDFAEIGSAQRVGEADVVLLLADGSLVVGECKRHGAGLDLPELGKLDRLADRVGAPWSFVATADRASTCPDVWPDCRRARPDRPRFALSAEHLLDLHPFLSFGADPLAWTVMTEEEHAERDQLLRERLPEMTASLSGDRGLDEMRLEWPSDPFDAPEDATD